MTHWSARLKQKRCEKGWTVVELARRSAIGKERLYKYEKGNVEAPRGDTLASLAKTLDVTELWLEHGVDFSDAGIPQRNVTLRRFSVISLSELSPLRPSDNLAAFLAKHGLETVPLPDVDVGPNAVVVRLDDNSMGEKFAEGTLVLCDPDQPALPGKYVVAVSHKAKRAVFRRYKSLAAGNGKGELVAENRDFPRLKLTSKKDGFIVGRAIMVIYKI